MASALATAPGPDDQVAQPPQLVRPPSERPLGDGASFAPTVLGVPDEHTPSLVFVSRAPQADIERVKARMGWEMPWYTLTDGFDADFGVDEWHGTNAFVRDGDRVFRTYFIDSRGDEAMGSTWSCLDLTALGRQEDWEDSPEGYPETPPYQWWNWHDEYGDAAAT